MNEFSSVHRGEPRVSQPGRPGGLVIRKAERRKAKLRLALVGPTGSGKTYSALRLAFGIGGSVGVIDTENGSADLYADLGDYSVITLDKPYTVEKYREAIAAFEDARFDVIIVDSLTHAWAGAGGLLDKHGQIAKRNPGQNSYTAWREVTPDHNALVEAMLTSPAHIIATMRVKTEYVLEANEKGKQVPRKVGLQPVQRDGLEYEFTIVMDVDADHKATASKDRTRLFDGWCDTITERTGARLREWLESGAEMPPPLSIEPPPEEGWLEKADRQLTDETDGWKWMRLLMRLMGEAPDIEALDALDSLPIVIQTQQRAPADPLKEIDAARMAARKRLLPSEEKLGAPVQSVSGGAFSADVLDPETGEVMAGPFLDQAEWAEAFVGYWSALPPFPEGHALVEFHQKTIEAARRVPQAKKVLEALDGEEELPVNQEQLDTDWASQQTEELKRIRDLDMLEDARDHLDAWERRTEAKMAELRGRNSPQFIRTEANRKRVRAFIEKRLSSAHAE